MKKQQVIFNSLSAILSLCGDVSKALKNRGNRQLLFVEGASDTVTIMHEHLQAYPEIRICKLPNLQNNMDRAHQIHALLGKEFDTILFDALRGFDAALFAACSGTVVAGGSLIVVTPNLDEWPKQEDVLYQQLLGPSADKNNRSNQPSDTSFYLKRFIRIIREQCTYLPGHLPIYRTQTNVADESHSAKPEFQASSNNAKCSTIEPWQKEQRELITELSTHLLNSGTSISVVMADRGRGKSALVGQAAAILQKNGHSIAITANLVANAAVLRRHYLEALNLPETGRETTSKKPVASSHKHSLPFYPIDRAEEWTGDVLIVEEAGSVPMPVLTRLANQCGRDGRHVIFVTTVHGYEGAGRSFAVQFKRWLDRHAPHWTLYTPTHPIRWHEGDAVESLTNELALLAQTDVSIDTPIAPNSLDTHLVCAEELFLNESLLQEVYGLLSQAHYQTTPNDLRHLLDQPTLSVFVLTATTASHHRRVLGVVLLASEGIIERQLHQSIVEKSRRIHNQLLPQLLAQCINSAAVLEHSYQRIIRIAIHPDCQRQGLGRHMLNEISTQFSTQGVTLGASFGATSELLAFWKRAGFKLIHFGHRKNSRSGLRSACVLRAAHSSIKKHIQLAHNLFVHNQQSLTELSHAENLQINNPTNELFESCRQFALSDTLVGEAPSSEFGADLLQRYIGGQRNFSDTAWALENFVTDVMDHKHQAPESQLDTTVLANLEQLSQWCLDGSSHQHGKTKRVAEAELKTWLVENRAQ